MLNDIVLACGTLGLLITLAVWHRTSDDFDLRWSVVDNSTGRVSLFKVGQLIALLASTWVLVYQTRTDHLTDWLFLAYIATWSGVNVANKWVDSKAPLPPDGENKG